MNRVTQIRESSRGSAQTLLNSTLALTLTVTLSYPAASRLMNESDDIQDDALDSEVKRERSMDLDWDALGETMEEMNEEGARMATLVITEIMYQPTTGVEWVEIYNPNSSAYSLDNHLLTDNEGVDVNEGEYWFPTGTTIAAGDYLVIGAGAQTGVDLVWNKTAGPALANAGDEVYLVRDSDRNGLFSSSDVLDGVVFKSSFGGAGNGKSLSRTCLDCSSSASSSWTSSVATGGTPGALNDTISGSTPTPSPLPGAGKKVLFDAAHCQTCGDADWIITGGYSDFATSLRALGFEVTSTKSRFTSSILSPYQVLVIPEPNVYFTTTEQTAMLDFLKAGKGIVMIANHYGSDRNGDGWDAVEVFNGYKSGTRTTSNDWLYNNFRFRFKESDYVQEPVTDVRSAAITTGIDTVAMWDGTTVDIYDSSRVTGVIYLSSSKGPMTATILPSIGGRVVAHGDSSSFDDGSCSCSDSLHQSIQQYDHAFLAENMVLWAAGLL